MHNVTSGVPVNRLLKTVFASCYKCQVMFASCAATQTLETIVFLFIASPKTAREGNDGLKRSIIPGAIKDYHCVCSRHFPDADASRDPQLNIVFGRHFASPKKQGTDRNKRAKRRESIRSNSSLSFNSVQDSCDAVMHLKQSLLLRHL